jgi:hypothetical protein
MERLSANAESRFDLVDWASAIWATLRFRSASVFSGKCAFREWPEVLRSAQDDPLLHPRDDREQKRGELCQSQWTRGYFREAYESALRRLFESEK